MFGGAYRGRRVLLTGHTGFKGSWLALWLTRLGAQVTGLSLDQPTQPCHWGLLGLGLPEKRVDIRDAMQVNAEMAQCRPEIVFHLAAQSLVRTSYVNPVDTWATNVMGTVHVLEACRHLDGLRAVVVVTTDKCYENTGASRPYREDDALGGHDAYSASKAATELAVASYRRAFMEPARGPLLATARAGNVIGGGDWADDRLVPDAVRACSRGEPLQIRSPSAMRPWQHVLDSLTGYLMLGERLLGGDTAAAHAWNFGPSAQECLSVEQLLCKLQAAWPNLHWRVDRDQHPHEAHVLLLDASLAQQRLGWRSIWDTERAISATAMWYRAWFERGELRTDHDLYEYAADARRQGAAWAH